MLGDEASTNDPQRSSDRGIEETDKKIGLTKDGARWLSGSRDI